MVAFLRQLISLIFGRADEVKDHPVNAPDEPVFVESKPVPPPVPPTPTPGELVAEAARAALGKDLTPDDKVPDEVACVAQLMVVINKTPYGLFPNLTFTPYLFNVLKSHPHWRATLTPSPGCIIVSPTVGDQIGHCGIFLTNTRIASNNSFGTLKGKWTDNYSFQNWVSYFRGVLHLHAYIFEPVDK